MMMVAMCMRSSLRTAQGEADVDIDANTGKVLSFDQDFDDQD